MAIEEEGKLILLAFTLTEEHIHRITFYKACNTESWVPNKLNSWKTIVKRRHGLILRTLNLDPGVAYLVKQMSNAGIITAMSCDGHTRSAPKVWFCGSFSAAWFEIVTKKFFEEQKLHYLWKIEVDSCGNYRLQAHKTVKEK